MKAFDNMYATIFYHAIVKKSNVLSFVIKIRNIPTLVHNR